MRTTLRNILFLMFVTTMIVSAARLSAAQTALRLERLEIDLWPEYDQPDMLVIYRATLSADTPLPASVTLRLPVRVEQPFAIAYRDENGNLFNAEHTLTTTDDWLLVTLETATPEFQFEYYDELTRSGDQRSYTFVWPGDYAIDQLGVSLLPPTGATEIQTDPILVLAQQDSGALGYQVDLGSLAEDQETQVMVGYNGAGVSIGQAAPQPDIQVSRGASKESDNILLIVVLVLASLLLIAGAAAWYFLRSRSQSIQAPSPQRRRTKRQRRSPKTKKPQAGSSSAEYCTQCGRRLQANDRFCGSCGTPVKSRTRSQD